MVASAKFKDVVLFITLYILLSFPPFLVFNREIIGDIQDRIVLDLVTIAVIGTGLIILITALLLASEGVDRYNQFLFAPTDVLSVLIEFSFVVAAISWWFVPEFTEWAGHNLDLDAMLLIVLVCQLPMVLFLSLMTAIGKAQ